MKNVAEKPADAPTPNRKKRILVVEDETPGRLFLLNQLKKAGLELDTAANGTIAVRKLKDTYYDAMILDLMLVDIKGQDLVKQIRKHEPWNHIKIFACTSPQRPDPWRGRAVKNGVTKLFDKGSCSVEDVVAEIVALLAPNSKEPVRADTVDPSSVTGPQCP